MTHHCSIADMRELCQEIAKEHFPYEEKLFDVLWASFVDYFGEQLFTADAKRVLIGVQAPEIISQVGVLGRGDTSELDLVYLFSVISNVSLSLFRVKELTQDSIVQVLSEELSQGHFPEHIRTTLGQHAGGMLCALYGISVKPAAPVVKISEERLWVEWYEEYISPEHDNGSIFPKQKSLTEAEIEEKKFREGDKKNYVLHVDEVRGSQILVKGKNVTSKFDRNHRARGFLYVLLMAFSSKRVLSRENIAEKALGWKRDDDRRGDSFRKVKEQFVKLTNNELGKYIESLGDESYRIQGQVPYCWIRPNNKESWLPKKKPRAR